MCPSSCIIRLEALVPACLRWVCPFQKLAHTLSYTIPLALPCVSPLSAPPLQFVGAFRIVDAEAAVPVTPNVNPATGKM